MIEMLNMDCMEFMASCKDKEFDLGIIDAPYGIGMDNQKVRTKPNRPNTYFRIGEVQYNESQWDDIIPTEIYFDELYRITKNQIIWGANYFVKHIPNGKGWIYWDKQMGDNQFSSGEFAYQSIQIKSSSFSYPSMRVAGTRIHPTQKPIALYRWLLKNYAKQGDKILDTHGGSFSSAIAVHQMNQQGMNLSYVGMEIDKSYYDMAIRRYNLVTSQTALDLK